MKTMIMTTTCVYVSDHSSTINRIEHTTTTTVVLLDPPLCCGGGCCRASTVPSSFASRGSSMAATYALLCDAVTMQQRLTPTMPAKKK
jgi:hypothetical protein